MLARATDTIETIDTAQGIAETSRLLKSRQVLLGFGIEQFNASRLLQLRHALHDPQSSRCSYSPQEKEQIESAILALVGPEKPQGAAKNRRKAKPVTELDFSFLQCDPKLQEILIKQFPRHPWCADLPGFVDNSPRRLDVALKKKYVQFNPPGLKSVLVVDVDRAISCDEHLDAGLPAPTWMAVNPANGHAHLAWVIESPVWTGGDNQKPARYFMAVQEAFRSTLRGDEGFAHTLTKNPAHAAWVTSSQSQYARYDLEYLAEFVRLKKRKPQRKGASIGRNCLLFEEGRRWAYVEVQRHTDREAFYEAVESQLSSMNMHLMTPMAIGEVLQIAKSITKWTWGRRHEFQSPSEWARACQRKSAEVRRANSQAKRDQARTMKLCGATHKVISLALGVSTKTVQRWLT